MKNASIPNTLDKNNDNIIRSSLTKKSSNIYFSPFNGVKVITHRSDMMEYCDDLWIANILNENENDDDYSYCEDDDESDSDMDNDDNDMNEDNDNEEEEEKGMDLEDKEVYIYDYPIEYDVEF